MEAAKTEEEKSWRAIVCEEIDEKVCEKRKEMLSMYKELIFKEQQKYLGSKFAPFSISRNDADEYCKYVPRLPLDPRCIQEPEYIVTLKTLMSKEEEKSHYFPPYFCGRSTSTYPFIEKNGCRDGEPICDQYCLMFSPPLSIIAVADGCNWGTGPAEAAIRASKAFIDHMNKSRDLFRSTNLVAHLCLDGIVAAHNSIIAGPYIEGKSIGTTTLLGGVLAKVILPNQKDNEPKNIKDWVFIFASIGDCKAFLYDKKKKTVEELTPDSRGENFMDASDCGGRIGPYIDGGPDLRNLEVFMSPCHEGDIIFVCSDGVHDNFDPQMQGETPKDLGATCDTWETIDATQANSIKAEYRCKRLKQVMNIPEDTDELDLSDITETVIKYCKDMSLPSQKFMQENPGKRLPNDYNRFPGKMDHTTLVTIRVGEYESERFEEFIKEKKVEHKKQRESAEDTEDGIELLLSIKKSATEPLIVRSESTKPKLISQKSMGEAPEKTRRVVPARRRKLNTSQSNLQSTDVLLKQGRELCSVAARNYRNIYTIIEETATEVELEKYIKLTIDSSAALIDFALNLGYFEEAESLKKLVTALISIVTVSLKIFLYMCISFNNFYLFN